MSLKKIDGLQSEVFVPITPKPVWAPVTKPLKDMTVAIVTAAGVHLKKDKPFNLAGDTTYRVVPGDAKTSDMMVSHGGYDNTDVNRDINCMFPIDRLRELAKAGFIKAVAPKMYTCMGGGGNVKVFTEKTGPEIAQKLLQEHVDAVVMVFQQLLSQLYLQWCVNKGLRGLLLLEYRWVPMQVNQTTLKCKPGS